jgi:uncharacterized protein
MDLHELIEALSAQSAYPEPDQAVEVHQTHISVVFLAGAFAYKIKKPVDLGFVDYGTLERRRHWCEEEVRLNQRLARDVYLGVVPVTRDDGVIRVEGEGDVVEWCVKMKRLPDRATLRAHLEAGDLGAVALGEWARRLARFHATAESGAEVAAFGSLEAIARNARENFEQAQAQLEVTVSRATLEKLKRRTETELARLAGLIEGRARRGVPRDTHGDLRLDHVYWFPDRRPPDDWIAVDCIEFAARFRYADPIADVAFLAMELTLEGRGDLAHAFVDAYLDAAGDHEGLLLLPFYRSYRAAVRGKVNGMKLAEVEYPEAARSVALTRARAFWLFALAELESPCKKPGLVLVAGLPGAGKSSLARALAEAAGFAVIRSDQVRKELAGRTEQDPAPARSTEDLYTAEWNDRTYAECLRRAEALIFEGTRVIIDATFHVNSRRRVFLDAARRWGITGCLIVCRANADVVRRRLADRQGDVSDAGFSVHARIAGRWDAPSPSIREVTRTIDNSGSLSNSTNAALEALQEFSLWEGPAVPC